MAWDNNVLQGGVDWATFNANKIPTAASNEQSLKPYTNGKWNAGMTSALVSGSLGMMSDFTNSMYKARALRAQATSYEAQMPLNYAAYRQNVSYLSEENFHNVARTIKNYKDLEGAQMTAMGASGFDVSAGDQRVIDDTEQKMKNEVYLQNRTAYLHSFELWRSTEMENNRLKAAANMARVQAKYQKRAGYIGLAAGALSTAAGVYSAANSGRTADIDVRGVKK